MKGTERAREVLAIEEAGIREVRNNLGAEFDAAVELLLACPSRVILSGIGKSGIVCQKIAATLNSTGTPAFFLHPVEAMHGDLGMVAATDVVLAASYSGETAELNALLGTLRGRQVHIIALTGNPASTLAGLAEVVLAVTVPQEACPLGLAPTASTTATLALGDALAVVLLEKKRFGAEDFRRNHPGGSLGERLKVGVSAVMLSGGAIPSVPASATLAEAVQKLGAKNLGVVLALDPDGTVAGILTDGDLRRLVLENRYAPAQPLAQVMSPRPKSIALDLLAADALSIMQQHEITALPVLDRQGVLQGIVHLHDLLGKGEFRFLV
ncbi:MAG: arabinose-5-phosphate isomerase [Desulfobulbaceae bacterium A2]|nr:MAG: arabinose-5-phosphate isomerase [Desulfobulbaceae bacterium A2]